MKHRKIITLSPLLIGTLFSGALYAHGDYERGQRVAIASPQNGAAVSNPVQVEFMAEGVKIAPAGVDKHNAGHFHLMVDVDADTQLDEPMQPSDQHRIFAAGEMGTTLTLAPGRHTLQLIVADEEHTHFENLVSSMVTIFVQE